MAVVNLIYLVILDNDFIRGQVQVNNHCCDQTKVALNQIPIGLSTVFICFCYLNLMKAKTSYEQFIDLIQGILTVFIIKQYVIVNDNIKNREISGTNIVGNHA